MEEKLKKLMGLDLKIIGTGLSIKIIFLFTIISQVYREEDSYRKLIFTCLAVLLILGELSLAKKHLGLKKLLNSLPVDKDLLVREEYILTLFSYSLGLLALNLYKMPPLEEFIKIWTFGVIILSFIQVFNNILALNKIFWALVLYFLSRNNTDFDQMGNRILYLSNMEKVFNLYIRDLSLVGALVLGVLSYIVSYLLVKRYNFYKLYGSRWILNE